MLVSNKNPDQVKSRIPKPFVNDKRFSVEKLNFDFCCLFNFLIIEGLSRYESSSQNISRKLLFISFLKLFFDNLRILSGMQFQTFTPIHRLRFVLEYLFCSMIHF
jgi:hypothetical protein